MNLENIKPAKYDSLNREWDYVDVVENTSNRDVKGLSLVSFNVWFSDYHEDERFQCLLSMLEKSDADCIALQEVTYHLLQLILTKDWIQKKYTISDFRGETFGGYGVLFLTKLNISSISIGLLPSRMDRKVLVVDFVINDSTVSIGVVHLESMKESESIRREQLLSIFPKIENSDFSILMGDFNFCAITSDENSNIPHAYIDVWSELKSDTLGYSVDSEVNTMLGSVSSSAKKKRIDRILSKKCSLWSYKNIELLGCKAVSKELPNIFVSDHFGLYCEVEWQGV